MMGECDVEAFSQESCLMVIPCMSLVLRSQTGFCRHRLHFTQQKTVWWQVQKSCVKCWVSGQQTTTNWYHIWWLNQYPFSDVSVKSGYYSVGSMSSQMWLVNHDKVHTHWPSFCIAQVITNKKLFHIGTWWVITSQNTVPCFYAAHSHHTAQPVFGQQWDDHCEPLSRWQWSPPVHRDEQQKQRKRSHLVECKR